MPKFFIILGVSTRKKGRNKDRNIPKCESDANLRAPLYFPFSPNPSADEENNRSSFALQHELYTSGFSRSPVIQNDSYITTHFAIIHEFLWNGFYSFGLLFSFQISKKEYFYLMPLTSAKIYISVLYT